MYCAVRYLPPNELKITSIFPFVRKKKYAVKSDKDEAAFSFYLCLFVITYYIT
jgi:hypothetical protein